jgi:DNA invertase Pin-like site-specific DNA recombinase
MDHDKHEKVGTEHRNRNAYLYVRQSTPRQVLENTESTQRQYGLRERALALGWDAQQIVVIDSDLGQSGASAADRAGFQKLVTEVTMGRAGIVLGLEVSRLARNSSDWHRLIDLCAWSNTLILDEDGIYDPGQFNDRLVLGLKGTMSEAELHVLRSRLRGGILNKVRRGEFAVPLPAGFLYDGHQQVIMDPDRQVQQSIRQLFTSFRRSGSVLGTVREFRDQQWSFPVRSQKGPRPGDLEWVVLTVNRAYSVLRNPRYAGAYAYGQNRNRRKPDGSGRRTERLPRAQWYTLQNNAHEGYLSWEEYEDNLRHLRDNAPPPRPPGRGAPREGPALLQGLAYCGVCGGRMQVRYHDRGEKLVPDYICDHATANRGEAACQSIAGASLDEAIGTALLETVTPLKLELALAVEQEIEARQEESDRLRQMQVERAAYEAGLAERRFKRVDPDNRLVAGTLEAEWNGKLRLLREAQQEYERLCLISQSVTAQAREQILHLAEDFPRIWQDPQTPARERKRMARLLLEDVTLTRGQGHITAQIRYKGGAHESIQVPIHRRRDPRAVAVVDGLLQDHHNYASIAAALNEIGIKNARGKDYNPQTVGQIVRQHRPSRPSGSSGKAATSMSPVAAESTAFTQNPGVNRGAV